MASVHPAISSFLTRPVEERRLGPFLLVARLGQGGFAPVWLAKEVYGTTELRKAAVKLFALPTRVPESDALRRRIIDEARALCQVRHPNVVGFYSLSVDDAAGIMGLAMEYADGISLDRRLRESGPLPATEALAIGIAVSSALAAVHRAGLVHRDVKPANIVETAHGYQLIDFGIAAADDVERRSERGFSGHVPDLESDVAGARLSELEESDGTVRFAVRCGTVGYIDPPSMAQGATATAQSDLYALGATLFECLTGTVPAAAKARSAPGSPGSLRGDVLAGIARPPHLSELVDVPRGLAEIVASLLEPDRQRRPRSAERVAIELEQALRALAGGSRTVPPESVGPFRGLGRFEENDRDVYFGRIAETAAAIEMLRGNGLVALIGPSGSGKSSLVRAAVLPALASGALSPWPPSWRTATVEPGVDPKKALLAALETFTTLPQDSTPETVVERLTDAVHRTETGLILFVDQLEELSTVAAGASRAWAALLLANLAETPRTGLRVLTTVRRDLLDPLLSLGALSHALVRSSVLVEPLSDSAWGGVLDSALGAYGYEFEDDALRRQVLTELAETSGSMPLAQFALSELWRNRDSENKRIRHRSLQAIGGIAGALDRHAEATFAEVTAGDASTEELARTLLLSLTTAHGTRAIVDERRLVGGDPTRRRILEAFERARMVVLTEDGVSLAHEALIVQWARLRRWVAEAREDRIVAEELNRDAARWKKEPETPLWRRRRLDLAHEVSRRRPESLTQDALQFISAGRRLERKTRLTIVGAASAALLLVAAAGAVYVQTVRAQREATAEALRKEQSARETAEARTRELQIAQQRVADLLAKLAASPSPDAVKALEREIQRAQAHVASIQRRPAGSGAATQSQVPKEPRISAAAAAPPPPAPPIKVQEEW